MPAQAKRTYVVPASRVIHNAGPMRIEQRCGAIVVLADYPTDYLDDLSVR
ncbi:hypothetical protein G1C97_0031 [Bifidobacterium sp. DSM 109959]|uniref:Uncharacterized protein n=1 Tax=Bifidobacterium olomucense TaxID=2675324 RepID=A0A7Y0HW99_9BIFI|nr:hypothetical protein [Bifidobacterium sp. DSM 109959]